MEWVKIVRVLPNGMDVENRLGTKFYVPNERIKAKDLGGMKVLIIYNVQCSTLPEACDIYTCDDVNCPVHGKRNREWIT